MSSRMCPQTHLKKKKYPSTVLYQQMHYSVKQFNGMHPSVLDVAISHVSNMNNVATLPLGMVFLSALIALI